MSYLTLKDFAQVQNGSSSVTGTSNLDPRQLASTTTVRARRRRAATGATSPAAGTLHVLRAALRSSTDLAGTDGTSSSDMPKSNGRLATGLAGLGAVAMGAWWLSKAK